MTIICTHQLFILLSASREINPKGPEQNGYHTVGGILILFSYMKNGVLGFKFQ